VTVLTRPAYLAALAVLVVNDVWLKYAWPGFATGKLSDVAGLFVFAVFASCVSRRPALACVAVSLAFAIWKSPLVEPLLALTPFSRVPDPTDLVAIAIVPAAYRYARREEDARPPVRLAHVAIAVLSVAAFANTSYAKHRFRVPAEHPASVFHISLPAEQAITRLKQCGFSPDGFEVTVETRGEKREFLALSYNAKAIRPNRHISASTVLTRKGGETTLELTDVAIYRQTEAGNEAAVMAEFARRMQQCFGAAVRVTG
jgi:hypothetical protein